MELLRRALVGVSAISLVVTAFVPAAAQAAEGIPATNLLGLLQISEPLTSPAYDRGKFEHWIDADRNGCNARYEVLIRSSLTPVEVVPPCKLFGGTWHSTYDEMVVVDPADIEIDHVVALAEAWRSGAAVWTDSERRDFANDLGVDYALVPSSGVANQKKADKDPARWLPTEPALVCDYVTHWTLLKYRWGLSVDQAEAESIAGELSGECGSRTLELPEVMRAPVDVVEPDDGTQDTENPGSEHEGGPALGGDPARTEIEPFLGGETRLAGESRYDTAITVSSRYSSGVPAVFVATGENFPDALSASAAAAFAGAPLLLTRPNALPAAVKAEIARLAPEEIFVVGGENVVSATVMRELDSVAPTVRMAGEDRYLTGLDIVSKSFDDARFAVIATGNSFPDALASTSVAGIRGGPVILVNGKQESVSWSVISALRSLGVTEVMIAGGTEVISTGIQNQLHAEGFNPYRRGGADRYETAAIINSSHFAAGQSTHFFLSTGQDFPDALSGAAIAGYLGMPLYVTRPTCMPDPIRSALSSQGFHNRIVLGGANAVSVSAASGMVCPPPPPPPGSGSVPGSGGYDCPVGYPYKGNHSSSGEKIYHVPSGASYKRTKPEQCFSTEAAAQAAGYRRALR